MADTEIRKLDSQITKKDYIISTKGSSSKDRTVISLQGQSPVKDACISIREKDGKHQIYVKTKANGYTWVDIDSVSLANDDIGNILHFEATIGGTKWNLDLPLLSDEEYDHSKLSIVLEELQKNLGAEFDNARDKAEDFYTTANGVQIPITEPFKNISTTVTKPDVETYVDPGPAPIVPPAPDFAIVLAPEGQAEETASIDMLGQIDQRPDAHIHLRKTADGKHQIAVMVKGENLVWADINTVFLGAEQNHLNFNVNIGGRSMNLNCQILPDDKIDYTSLGQAFDALHNELQAEFARAESEYRIATHYDTPNASIPMTNTDEPVRKPASSIVFESSKEPVQFHHDVEQSKKLTEQANAQRKGAKNTTNVYYISLPYRTEDNKKRYITIMAVTSKDKKDAYATIEYSLVDGDKNRPIKLDTAFITTDNSLSTHTNNGAVQVTYALPGKRSVGADGKIHLTDCPNLELLQNIHRMFYADSPEINKKETEARLKSATGDEKLVIENTANDSFASVLANSSLDGLQTKEVGEPKLFQLKTSDKTMFYVPYKNSQNKTEYMCLTKIGGDVFVTLNGQERKIEDAKFVLLEDGTEQLLIHTKGQENIDAFLPISRQGNETLTDNITKILTDPTFDPKNNVSAKNAPFFVEQELDNKHSVCNFNGTILKYAGADATNFYVPVMTDANTTQYIQLIQKDGKMYVNFAQSFEGTQSTYEISHAQTTEDGLLSFDCSRGGVESTFQFQVQMGDVKADDTSVTFNNRLVVDKINNLIAGSETDIQEITSPHQAMELSNATQQSRTYRGEIKTTTEKKGTFSKFGMENVVGLTSAMQGISQGIKLTSMQFNQDGSQPQQKLTTFAYGVERGGPLLTISRTAEKEESLATFVEEADGKITLRLSEELSSKLSLPNAPLEVGKLHLSKNGEIQDVEIKMIGSTQTMGIQFTAGGIRLINNGQRINLPSNQPLNIGVTERFLSLAGTTANISMDGSNGLSDAIYLGMLNDKRIKSGNSKDLVEMDFEHQPKVRLLSVPIVRNPHTNPPDVAYINVKQEEYADGSKKTFVFAQTELAGKRTPSFHEITRASINGTKTASGITNTTIRMVSGKETFDIDIHDFDSNGIAIATLFGDSGVLQEQYDTARKSSEGKLENNQTEIGGAKYVYYPHNADQVSHVISLGNFHDDSESGSSEAIATLRQDEVAQQNAVNITPAVPEEPEVEPQPEQPEQQPAPQEEKKEEEKKKPSKPAKSKPVLKDKNKDLMIGSVVVGIVFSLLSVLVPFLQIIAIVAFTLAAVTDLNLIHKAIYYADKGKDLTKYELKFQDKVAEQIKQQENTLTKLKKCENSRNILSGEAIPPAIKDQFNSMLRNLNVNMPLTKDNMNELIERMKNMPALVGLNEELFSEDATVRQDAWQKLQTESWQKAVEGKEDALNNEIDKQIRSLESQSELTNEEEQILEELKKLKQGQSPSTSLLSKIAAALKGTPSSALKDSLDRFQDTNTTYDCARLIVDAGQEYRANCEIDGNEINSDEIPALLQEQTEQHERLRNNPANVRGL